MVVGSLIALLSYIRSNALVSKAHLPVPIDLIELYPQSSSHPAGTAAMAPRELGGVVGADLKVYGTTNLRVVDASVMPIIVGANLQETVYAIAEKVCHSINRNVDANSNPH